jgi:uncharacterized protein YlxW (UPF0749 family)
MNNPQDENAVKTRVNALFIVTGIAIGLLITTQFRSAIPSSTYIYDELRAQNELISSYITDQGLLKTRITALREEIDIAQENTRSQIESNNNLETLKALKHEIGLETVKGAGLEIYLDDGLFVDRKNADTLSQSLINASDLRDIVNALRTAKPLGISINDQRVISTSPITSVGNTILVNNYHLLPPFNIKVVGDPDVIKQRLDDKSLLPDLLKRVKEHKIQLKTEKKEHLTLPVFNGNLSVKLINQIK